MVPLFNPTQQQAPFWSERARNELALEQLRPRNLPQGDFQGVTQQGRRFDHASAPQDSRDLVVSPNSSGMVVPLNAEDQTVELRGLIAELRDLRQELAHVRAQRDTAVAAAGGGSAVPLPPPPPPPPPHHLIHRRMVFTHLGAVRTHKLFRDLVFQLVGMTPNNHLQYLLV